MDRSRGRGPSGARAAETARVQPDEGDVDDESVAQEWSEQLTTVTENDLVAAEKDLVARHAAANLDRRAADQELRDELAKSNFTGPSYDAFADALARYALEVVTAWLVTGQMFRECAKRRYRIGGRPEHWTDHDITGLADETVMVALNEFREKGLRGGGWRFDEGASIRTYFITLTVYKFLNVYRDWRTQQERWNKSVLFNPADVEVVDAVGADDVLATAVNRIDANVAYRHLNERQKSMAILSSLGYTHLEIAELLDEANPKVIEGVLYRVRRAANERVEDERGASS